MTTARAQVDRFVILCVGQAGATVAPPLRRALGPLVEVEEWAGARDAIARIGVLATAQAAVPVIVAGVSDLGNGDPADQVGASEGFGPPLLLAIDAGADAATVAAGVPFAEAVSGRGDGEEDRVRTVRRLLTDYIIEHAPGSLTRLCGLLDAHQMASALAEAERESDELHGRLRMLRHSITSASRLSDDAAEAQMIRILRHAMHDPREQHLPAGTVLFEEDLPIEGIWVVVDGVVELTRRSAGKDIVFHSKSVGRIVGLMALVGHQNTFFTARAAAPVTAIYLTWKELDDALQREPALLIYFLTVHTRSLGNRLRRIVELQLQIEDLNSDLAAERDHLADALAQLEAAQARLIEQEKMATLGQLVAGVGHELNNPATAITRAAEYVVEDASRLIRELPEGPALEQVLIGGMTTTPLPTAALRRRREELAAALRDDDLARRLLRVGITTIEAYKAAFGRDRADVRDRRLALQERAFQLGSSLRNIRSGGERISAIVKSLRSYARVEAQPTAVDLHEGLEETLLLFQVRLQTIKVRRRYGDIPTIRGWAGQLNQVWTNLISNALDAMGDDGELMVQTEAPPGTGEVVVRVIDNGPGVDSEHLERIFDLNFTTKRAGAGFGLGMGLVICRQIVTRHGGRIRLDSQPGRTSAEVVLPIEPPEKEA